MQTDSPKYIRFLENLFQELCGSWSAAAFVILGFILPLLILTWRWIHRGGMPSNSRRFFANRRSIEEFQRKL